MCIAMPHHTQRPSLHGCPFSNPRTFQVALVDPRMCMFLTKPQTLAMALVALSSCMDAMVAWEVASSIGTQFIDKSHPLFQLATNGIAAVSEGLPTVLAEGKGISARELLAGASLCAGQLSVITPAPPIQVGHNVCTTFVCLECS